MCKKSDDGFKVKMRLHHGSTLSPFLFSVLMDKVEFKIRHESQWITMFPDDIATRSETRQQAKESLEGWRHGLQRGGMTVPNKMRRKAAEW